MPSDNVVDPSPSASSHMMKTTKRGRPYLKDTLDLFATLITSLTLSTNKQFFRSFPNSFTTDQAAQNLASLRFQQSNRGPDPREPSRVITTTTTTTFSMTREMAKAMCQHFMDARLIENAADPNQNLFKDRGVFALTPKGLHVLERFISRNGMSTDHLAPVFASQPICIKLLHLERRSTDDEIIVSQSVITALFRRFAGRQPNYPPAPNTPLDAFQRYNERSKGIAVSDVTERTAVAGKTPVVHKYCFAAVSALEWLCDFTSIEGREEAAEMAAQFVRFGLITLVSDKRKNNDSAIIFTVRGAAGSGNSPISQHGEFRCTSKAIYKVTEEGYRVALWTQGSDSAGSSSANLSTQRSSVDDNEHEKKAKESNTERLRYILEDPGLRPLFRDFLRTNFCEENLSFWLDVQDFKKRFNITSSAMASSVSRTNARNPQAAMERHHESLINTAFNIYNKYLAPSSQCELNIDHALRNELSKYLEDVVTSLTGKAFSGRVEPEQAASFNATQLQTMIRLYERIQAHVFRLMATDSVPKFIKTAQFLALRDWDDKFDPTEEDVLRLSSINPSNPPGLREEVGGAYMTVSQAGSEREHAHREQVLAATAASNSP